MKDKPCSDCLVLPDGRWWCDMNCGPCVPPLVEVLTEQDRAKEIVRDVIHGVPHRKQRKVMESYRDPLEEHTYSTYGGITRNGASIEQKAGIVITGLVAPTEGWPIVAHCEICKKTEIILSIFAIKPERGDYWRMEGVCLDEEHCVQHNLYPQSVFPWSPAAFLTERSIVTVSQTPAAASGQSALPAPARVPPETA